MLKKLFKRRKQFNLKEGLTGVSYLAVVNDKWQWFEDRDSLLRYVEDYSSKNVIYSLNMQRIEVYQLEKSE